MKRNKNKQQKMRHREKFNLKVYNDYPVILEDLFELTEKYTSRSVDLQIHKDNMDGDVYIIAQASLAEQFAAELELKRAQAQSNADIKFYLAEGLTEELRIFSKRRYFRWYDSAMKKILDERISCEAGGRLAELGEGFEPDETENLFNTIVDEFVPAIKQRRFIWKNKGYLIWLLSEGEQNGAFKTTEELFDLVSEVLVPRICIKNFRKKYGDYLKGLLSAFLYKQSLEEEMPEAETSDNVQAPAEAAESAVEPTEEVPAEETPEPEEEGAEDELDEYAELEELEEEFDEDSEDELDAEELEEEPKLEPEEPVQEENLMTLADNAQMLTLVPQETDNQNDNGETVNE